MSNYYAGLLADLRRRRASLEAEIRGLDTAIAAIQPLAGESSVFVVRSSIDPATLGAVAAREVTSTPPVAVAHAPSNRYANLSVRWAALWQLAEFASGPMRNVELAEAISQGGYRSNADRFPNAVSAVVSGMKERGEVAGNADDGYYLTDFGRQTWAHIKQGVKFRDATASTSADEHSLLSVQ